MLKEYDKSIVLELFVQPLRDPRFFRSLGVLSLPLRMNSKMGDPENGGGGVSEDSDVDMKYSYDSSKRHNHYLNLCKVASCPFD